MLTRTHVTPFLRRDRGNIRVSYLTDPDGRIVAFLDRLCRLVRRLENKPRSTVVEALRRQERRVRDVTRLAGLAKTVLDLCHFTPPVDAQAAPDLRHAVFRARGERWPPVPGDHDAPYAAAAAALGRATDEVRRLLYADAPGARVLRHAPRLSGRSLLARYNVELARGVLLDAERVTVTARGGWRGIFTALKAARLMHVVRRVGRSYQAEITGPAAPFIVRPARYGVRLARIMPALMQSPGWRLDAEVRGSDGTIARFRARGSPRAKGRRARVGELARRPRYDSAWERSLASEFRQRFGRDDRSGWTLSRETTPVAAGDELFLPDFTMRHADGREALIELVGFWTPEYLEAKARKVAAAGLDNLILVVYRGLGVGNAGAALEELTASVGLDHVVWFATRPRAADVVKCVELHAR